MGAAMLLVRRPPGLLLLVGPSCSGKSRIAAALAAALPAGSARLVERDRLLRGARRKLPNLDKARAVVHDEVRPPRPPVHT